MTPEQIRLEALRLSHPQVASPDLQKWVGNARVLEQYISGAGQPSQEAPQQTAMELPQARTNRERGPASRR